MGSRRAHGPDKPPVTQGHPAPPPPHVQIANPGPVPGMGPGAGPIR
jgi:hypothetical protein